MGFGLPRLGELDEFKLAAHCGLIAASRYAAISPIRSESPGTLIIFEGQTEQFGYNAFPQAAVGQWEHGFDTAEEIARHPIRAAKKYAWLAAVLKIENPAVFEKAIHDAPHFDVLADTLQSGPQTADATDNQINFHARL
jgi:hypothetical protein